MPIRFFRSPAPVRQTGAVLLLSCASLAAMGQTPASDVVFPALDSSYLKVGAFIGPDHVKRITPGLGKDQVRLELGHPHFSEGIFAVREWDYAFNFYTGKGNEYVTCQYKIQFDSVEGQYRVASTHWKDGSCERYLNPVVAQAATAPAAAPAALRRITLGADGLFGFGKLGFDDLLPGGRAKLQTLAADIQRDGVAPTAIEITGHTDRIGSDAANHVLSQARADTVRDYLASQGLERRLIQAHGAGKLQPVVQCAGHKVTPQLVACLQPNRRVEIAVQAQY